MIFIHIPIITIIIAIIIIIIIVIAIVVVVYHVQKCHEKKNTRKCYINSNLGRGWRVNHYIQFLQWITNHNLV